MKRILIASTLLFLVIVNTADCLAQSDTWTIITVAPDTIRSCLIGDVENGRVDLIRTTGEVVSVPVDSIGTLVRRHDSQFWSGAGYGALIGGGAGIILGIATYEKPEPYEIFAPDNPGSAALVGGIGGGFVGFVVGGLIGATSAREERYVISHRSVENKRIILRQLGVGNQAR